MKILLAVDGSEFSPAATQVLVSQTRREGAEVLVLRVVEPRAFFTPPQMAPGYAPEQDGIIKEDFLYAQESVDQASQALRSAGFNVNTRVVEAETRNGILDIAAEWRADLVVLGLMGPGFFVPAGVRENSLIDRTGFFVPTLRRVFGCL